MGIGDKGKKRKHRKGWSVPWVMDPPTVNTKVELAERYKTDGDSIAIKNILRMIPQLCFEKQWETTDD